MTFIQTGEERAESGRFAGLCEEEEEEDMKEDAGFPFQRPEPTSPLTEMEKTELAGAGRWGCLGGLSRSSQEAQTPGRAQGWSSEGHQHSVASGAART